jgi:protein-tyrosine-phosphatase
MTQTGTPHPHAPLRVLFLCTANASRSQIAEALLVRKGKGRFEVASAGVAPATAVHPMAIDALADHGIDWSGRAPKGLEAVIGQEWDFVITVCERAKEVCASVPGHPVYGDWGVEDPTVIEDEAARQIAFRHTVQTMGRRVDLMLAVPFETLARRAREERLRRIGHPAGGDRQEPAANRPPS